MLSRGPQLEDANFIVSCRRAQSPRLRYQSMTTCCFGDKGYFLLTVSRGFSVKFRELLVVRPENQHRQIDASLFDHDTKTLAGMERELITMALSSGQFSRHGASHFQLARFQVSLRRPSLYQYRGAEHEPRQP